MHAAYVSGTAWTPSWSQVMAQMIGIGCQLSSVCSHAAMRTHESYRHCVLVPRDAWADRSFRANLPSDGQASFSHACSHIAKLCTIRCS